MRKKVSKKVIGYVARGENYISYQKVKLKRIAVRARLRMMDPYVRTMRARLESLGGNYSGQRCFIMGNGPSLNKMDLNLFKGEFVWASNKAYLALSGITLINLKIINYGYLN